MKKLLLFPILLTLQGFSQTSFCPDDPPRNTWLADSPWPVYHRNNYAQASTCITGPRPGDSLRVYARTNLSGGTSPWVYLSDRYANGQRVFLYSNSTHVFKLVDMGNEIIAADSHRIDFDPITSFGWNFLLSKHKTWFTYDPKYDPANNQSSRIFKLTDADTTDPFSEIVVLDTFDFADHGINRVQLFNLNYNGEIHFNSESEDTIGYATVGVIDQNFNLLDTLRYTTLPGEIVHHNAFPIDENNSFYIVTTHRMIQFTWTNGQLGIGWEAPYDFVDDGPTGSFAEGSGTTPTLVGWGAGQDKLVVVADGHSRNNLVAFWRELPAGWTGKPGMALHFADSIQLPKAIASNNTFQSIENSPTAYGYDIAIAQFNGFLGYPCTNNKGVQKVAWDTTSNSLSIAWTNDSINMNGVLTYSAGSDMVYGSGKEPDCNYYFYGLDWQTGQLTLRHRLGPEGTFTNDPYYDGGNNNILDEDGNVYFPGGKSLVKVEIVQPLASVDPPAVAPTAYTAFPQPATSELRLSPAPSDVTRLQIYSVTGQFMETADWKGDRLDISALPAGMYWLGIEKNGRREWVKWVKL